MRFNNSTDEFVYDITLDGTCRTDGSVESRFGWFARVDLDREVSREAKAIEHYKGEHLLVTEDATGFVSVFVFDDAESADGSFKTLSMRYSLDEAGVEDVQFMAAFFAYMQAAIWTEDDGEHVPGDFSARAQLRMKHELAEFITQNIDDVRQFLETTNLGWEQIGHDFWLTRNGHGSGFWDRGFAGETIDNLVVSSKAFGESSIYVNEQGEMEVDL